MIILLNGGPTFIQGGTFTTISSYLKNLLLQTVPSLRLANIYDYETTDLAGFPAATVTVSDTNAQVIDNTRTGRHYVFTIRVFIDRNKQNFGANKAEQVLRQVADDFVSKLDLDYTLGGNVIEAKPFGAKFGYVDREQNNIRLMEVTLDCLSVVTWR